MPRLPLVQDIFAMAGVVAREDREKFIEEYFGMEQGLWLAVAGGLAGCVGLRRLAEAWRTGT